MKVLQIALKDLKVVFRDTGALVMMLVTPFALTLAIASAFGGLGGGSGVSRIPVVLVNRDEGELGAHLVAMFEAAELANLVSPTALDDIDEARRLVDVEKATAAVMIPPDFTAVFMPDGSSVTTRQALIEVYANPSRPISSGVIRAAVERFLSATAAGAAAGEVAVHQMMQSGLIAPQQAVAVGQAVGERTAQEVATGQRISITQETVVREGNGNFNWLGYMAPSMAIMFLMFTTTGAGRSLLVERSQGTLPRLLTTPTHAAAVLGGKVLGAYLTGLAQMTILIVASSLIFDLNWGSIAGVALLTLALVAAATAWGMFIAAYSRTPAQANAVGTALTLTFGGVAGNFIPRFLLPTWLRLASYISPNAWGLEGFGDLAAGAALADIGGGIVALLVMAVVIFGLAVIAFRRQYA